MLQHAAREKTVPRRAEGDDWRRIQTDGLCFEEYGARVWLARRCQGLLLSVFIIEKVNTKKRKLDKYVLGRAFMASQGTKTQELQR